MISERDRIAYEETLDFNKENRYIYGLKFFKNWVLGTTCIHVFPSHPVRVKLHRMRGVKIGKNVYIGYDVIFDRIHPEQIPIEDYAEIGDRCIISAHSRGSLPLRTKYPRSVQPVKIGMGVWMAPGCIVIQGVEIGEKSVIGTGAVVTRSIPPNCLAAGVPAKVIKRLDEYDEK